MDSRTVLFLAVAGAVTALSYWIFNLCRGDEDRLRERLAAPAAAAGPVRETGLGAFLKSLGASAASPFMPKKRETQSALRKELARAGIYSPATVRVVIGAKVLCLAAGAIAGYILGAMAANPMLGLSVGGLLGYLTPRIWLKLAIGGHQKALTQGLPDALDLMVICVEAGLTIDSAMQRVGQELALAHPRISRELGIAHMETRVGLSRSESLRNLGARTANQAFQSLVAMLIQAERFGTSIATALRIHADSLRIERKHASEEMAAKASVKLSFPLVMFILPATFIVMAGPFIITLVKSDLLK